MREFHILQGRFEGDYPIYEGIEEFHKYRPDLPYRKWGRDQNPSEWKIGDWVEALDGYIVQILSIRIWGKSPEYPTYAIRFPMGTFPAYRTKANNKWKYRKFFAQFTVEDPNSLSGKQFQNRTKLTKEKEDKFAKLIVAGIPPVQAYGQAGYRMTNRSRLFYQIGRLLMSEEVGALIKKERDEYLEKIKADEAFNDENMIKYVKDFMTHVRRGSKVHLDSIIPLLQLLGKLPQDEFKSNKYRSRDVDEVPYELVTPPL